MPIQQSSAGALGQFSWRNPPPGVASPATGAGRLFDGGCALDGYRGCPCMSDQKTSVHTAMRCLMPETAANLVHTATWRCAVDQGLAQTDGLTAPFVWLAGTVRAAYDMGTVVSPAKVPQLLAALRVCCHRYVTLPQCSSNLAYPPHGWANAIHAHEPVSRSQVSVQAPWGAQEPASGTMLVHRDGAGAPRPDGGERSCIQRHPPHPPMRWSA